MTAAEEFAAMYIHSGAIKISVFASVRSVLKSTDIAGLACQHGQYERSAMTKLAAVRRMPRRPGTPRRPEMASLVEGQIVELCRDIAIEVKRIRRLQTQTGELRLALAEWLGYAEPRGCDDIG